MKKILASTLAVLMTAAMLTACGDSDSSSKADTSSKTTTTTTTADSSSEAAPESSDTESTDDSSTTDSTTDSGTDSEAPQPKPLSEMPAALKNYENASLKFTTDMDVNDFVSPLAEDKGKGAYVPNTDESKVKLSIEEVEGIPMIRVQVLDMTANGANYAIPKIRFDMSKLFAGHEEDLPKIFTIKADFVTKAVGEFTGDDGTVSLVPGNFMGAFITQPTDGNGSNTWNDLTSVAEAEWTSEWAAYEVKMRPGIKPAAVFLDSTDPQYISFMRWGIPNQADFYIADFYFEDEEGNKIDCPYGK